jgi:hypothetical protein
VGADAGLKVGLNRLRCGRQNGINQVRNALRFAAFGGISQTKSQAKMAATVSGFAPHAEPASLALL